MTRSATAALALGLILAPGVSAADLMIYPSKGQSQEQQDKDRFECHGWAVEQTGFDPSRPPTTAAAPQQQSGGVVRGAARGAAVGAVGGAIGGDAGKGAAIGAGVGAAGGGIRQRRQNRDAADAAAQQQAGAQAARGDYDRALAACLEPRGYSVK